MTPQISQETEQLIKEASAVFKQNFASTTWFGRCVFLSWYCERGTCNFCFRSTTRHQIKHAQNARRSIQSVLTDAIIGKHLGWQIEFLTGGYGIFKFDEIVEVARLVSEVYGQKIWINLGALSKEEMIQLQPYVEGICASIETLEPQLHDAVCPDKPIAPYSEMLDVAGELGFKKGITIVIGLGEHRDDFDLLVDFIEKQGIDRITFYALKPVRGTPYEKSPEIDDYVWWIAKTRVRFPKIKIMAGLTPKKIDYTKHMLKAGVNGITKFPVVRKFNSKESKEIELSAEAAGRKFEGTLTHLPDVDWEQEVKRMKLSPELEQKTKECLLQTIGRMKEKI